MRGSRTGSVAQRCFQGPRLLPSLYVAIPQHVGFFILMLIASCQQMAATEPGIFFMDDMLYPYM